MPPTQCHLTVCQWSGNIRGKEFKFGVFFTAFTHWSCFGCQVSSWIFTLQFARASNDFHSRSYFAVSLLYNYYERNAYCAAATMQYYLKLQDQALRLQLTVTPPAGGLIVKLFFFRVVVEDSYCERLESYPVRALLLWSFLKLQWVLLLVAHIQCSSSCFELARIRFSFCSHSFCLFRTR